MKFIYKDGIKLPVLGLGGWRLGDDPVKEREEIKCVCACADSGVTLLDTAEMYGNGNSERLFGKAIKAIGREKLFITDKILPGNANAGKFFTSLENSLKRLGTDRIDLYLLHWHENEDIGEVVRLMQTAVKQGKILHWGVSNFDTDDMQKLFGCEGGKSCFENQVLYNVSSRGIEFDLLPFCKSNGVQVAAYSPLGSDLPQRRKTDAKLKKIAKSAGVKPDALKLAFVIRSGIQAIFKTGNINHLEDNLKCLYVDISKYMPLIDGLFPPPDRKIPLETI